MQRVERTTSPVTPESVRSDSLFTKQVAFILGAAELHDPADRTIRFASVLIDGLSVMLS